MASEKRAQTDALEFYEALRKEPYRFGFYQALRMLECAHADKPRLGTSIRPNDDPVRLAQEPSLTFAPATLSKFQPGDNGRPWRLEQRFLGLLGPNGPLPLHLTEYARERLRNSNDRTFSRFLDVFHHRMLSLFYRVWADAQPTVSFDRPDSDRFATYVGSLFGLGMPSLRNRDAMPDLAKLCFAGRLALQSRPAEGLQAMLQAFFDVAVDIEEFVGHWMDLPDDCRLRLARTPENGSLGVSATVGSRVWDCQYKFRIVLGPVSITQFRRLLPGGDSLPRLIALVRNCVGDEIIWDLQLILTGEDVPAVELGRAGELGRTSWLKSQPFARDADDLVIDAGELIEQHHETTCRN